MPQSEKKTPPEGEKQKPTEDSARTPPKAPDAPTGGAASKKAKTPPKVDLSEAITLRPKQWFDHILPGVFSREMKTDPAATSDPGVE